MYSANEVFRTAHIYIERDPGVKVSFSDFSSRPLKHGINEVCRCCKSTSTEELKGAEAIPWLSFYASGAYDYKAYKCMACGYMFSWYRPKTNHEQI